MNTPAHAVLNLLILGRKNRPKRCLPIVVGALAPDMPMFFFYFYEKIILHEREDAIWSERYFDADWQGFFNLFNSLPLMLLGMLIAARSGATWLVLFFFSMILHVFEDLPLHHADAHAHAHFFPFSDWRFQSPVSYWNPSYYGHIVAPMEGVAVLVGSIFLLRRDRSPWAKTLIGGLLAVYLVYWVYAIWVWS
ncbi:MAG: hypothetical protein ACE5GK_11125 [Nitrospiria bacterium]